MKMQRVQHLVLVTLALVLLAAAASAQPVRRSAEERTDEMAKALALSSEQKAKVLEIFKAADEARQQFAEAHQGDREAMREEWQKLRKETDTKLKEVLTEEQYAKWEKMRAEMQGPRGRRGQ